MPYDAKDTNANEAHNLDDVNDKLYRRDLVGHKIKRIDSMHVRPVAVAENWKESTDSKDTGPVKPDKYPSLFRKFFFFSLGFAGLAIVIALIAFFTGGNTISNNSININVLGNSFAAGGEELPLQIEVENKNTGALELSDLFVEYNKGGDASGGATHVRELNSLGTIEAGKTVRKNIFVTLYGAQGSTQDITFTLQYRLHASNAIFVKKTVFTVTINSAPVSLAISAPENLTPNQQLSFTVKTTSNTKTTLEGMLLHVDYPTGFNFQKAVPAPTSFNNVWNLGDLAPGATRDIVITGTVYGQEGEDRAFHVYAGAVSASDNTKIGVTYNSLLQTVSLVRPFIATHILINGSNAQNVPVQSASTVTAQVTYANNLPTQVTNAEVTLSISGNALDASSIIVPKGFYDSAKQTITWNSTTEPALASIQPSDHGGLDLSFKVKPLLTSGQVIGSPSIKFSVSIKGKQPEEGGQVSMVTDFEERTAVVSSDLGFSTSALHYSGPFSNTGSVPPKANNPTTYTIVWGVTNSANPLANGMATASLPSYVDWVGTISPQNEPITYDSTTRMIHWSIGAIPTGTGLAGASRTVSFQVRLNPSTSQVGSVPKLVLETSVSARDTFTGENLSTSRPAVSTILQNDPDFQFGGEVVTN